MHGVSAGMREGAGGISQRRRCSRACRSAWTRATASASSGATAMASRRCCNLLAGAARARRRARAEEAAPCAWVCWGRPTSCRERRHGGARHRGRRCLNTSGAGDARIRGIIAGLAARHPLGSARWARFRAGSGRRVDLVRLLSRRLGRACAGRADQPPGRARYHVAGGRT